MVAIGTLISTFWILASNSWMQTPQGFRHRDGHVVPLDWFKIIFNPSFPYRLAHMAIAAFIVAGARGRGRRCVASAAAAAAIRPSRRCFRWRSGCCSILTPIQAFVGDQHGLNTRKYQPAKIAAIEGLWETEKGGTALNLFGIPDMQAETTRYAVSIPHLGSLILTHSWDGEIRGLKEFPKEDRAEFDRRVLELPDHGGPRRADDRDVGRRLGAAPARQAVRTRSGSRSCVAGDGTDRLHHAAGRLGHDRSGPSAVGRLRRDAHRRRQCRRVTTQQVGVSLMVFVIVYFLVFGTGIYYMLKLLRSGRRCRA